MYPFKSPSNFLNKIPKDFRCLSSSLLPLKRIKFAYDGTKFYGYARQPNLETVEGEIIKTCLEEEIFNEEVGAHYGSQMSNATALRDMFNNPSTLTD